MKTLWYQDGLRFQCTRCGNCCTGEPGFVWVNQEEIQSIADFLGEPSQQTKDFYTRRLDNKRSLREKPNGDCVFYHREEGCTIYPVRPRQCRTWPFWESNLSKEKTWQETCNICPGAGQGDLISVEEITTRINAIRL